MLNGSTMPLSGMPNTPPNAATAAAVNARIAADASMVRARARLWTLAGVGALVALTGVGIGALLAGYQSRLEMVTGTVKLDDNARVRLDTSGATVKLDASGATVKLDAGAPPSPALPRASEEHPQSGAHVVRDYVIFNNVDIPAGRVQTGWEFASSEDVSPHRQFCQILYGDKGSNTYMTTKLALDHVPVPVTEPVSFDVGNALRNCTWFGSSAEGRF
jgi:hypothetical protein